MVPFFRALAAKKKLSDFSEPLPDLESTLERFVAAMETQFRRTFFANATRHTVFRHAPTLLNGGRGQTVRFQGQSNQPILPVAAGELADILEAVAAQKPAYVFSSPALRATQSLALVAKECAIPKPIFDDRLLEMNYGRLEGLSIGEARVQFPEVFQGWEEERDPRLPGGESVADVAARGASFARDVWAKADGPSLTCTHNVVLRCLIGSTLGVPPLEWIQLQIPHLAPVTFVQTANDGLFLDIPETVQPLMFALWEPATLRKGA
jgi:ribonuclease H / adenosylcobalamin/alpha-ribazole phosphatase